MTVPVAEAPSSESLLALTPEQFSSLQPFIPDTPWTTTVLHVLTRRQGRVFVDSPTSPLNLVVIALGDQPSRTLDRAFLFGVPTSDALKSYVAGIKAPTEIVCDDDVVPLVLEHHPQSRKRELIVHWFDRVEDAQAIQVEPGAKRLRISDSDLAAPLFAPGELRTFRTPRDLVTGGSAFTVDDAGTIVNVAYSADQSVKFERIVVSTAESHRKRGHASLSGRRLIKCIADQARVPCMVVDRTDAAGLRVAEKLGFNQKAVMPVWTTRLRGF